RRPCGRCSPRSRQPHRDQDGLAGQPARERGLGGGDRASLVRARVSGRRRQGGRTPRPRRARILGRSRHRRLSRRRRPARGGRAAWLIMSGERIPAEQAERWGLIELVVDDLEEGIERVAGTLAKQSPHTLRQIKSVLRETRLTPDYAREAEAFAACLSSEDGQ